MNKLSRVAVVLLLISILNTVACASQPKGFVMPPALSESLRNGELKGLESNDTGLLGMPNETELVSRNCVSKPLFNLYGQYMRTVVRCW